jgi:hypothetical protein
MMPPKKKEPQTPPKEKEPQTPPDEIKILFAIGHGELKKQPRVIKKDNLKEEFLKYLDTYKLIGYAGRYEELHQRIVNLIDS